MNRRTIAAHLPCNFAGAQFEHALQSLGWADNIVIHDASPGQAVSELVRKMCPRALIVVDDDPDLRTRFLRHKDATSDDYVAWVFADEDWSGPLATEILEFLSGDSEAVGLDILSEVFYFSESFGLRGPYCRVSRRDKLRFPMETVHDMPNPDGPIHLLKSKFLHFQDQNMLIFWMKNYKYCVVDGLQEGATNRSPFDCEGRVPLSVILKYLLKINFHFLKGIFAARDRGLAGVFWAQTLMIRQIAVYLVPAEAQRLVRLNQQYEMVGHTDMPKLPGSAAKVHDKNLSSHRDA